MTYKTATRAACVARRLNLFVIFAAAMLCPGRVTAASQDWWNELRTAYTLFVDRRQFGAAVKQAEIAVQRAEAEYCADSWQRRFADLELASYRRAFELPWNDRRTLDETLDLLKAIHLQTEVKNWTARAADLEKAVSRLEELVGGQCWLFFIECVYLEAVYDRTGEFEKSRSLADKKLRYCLMARKGEDPLLARARIDVARWSQDDALKRDQFVSCMRLVAENWDLLPSGTRRYFAVVMSVSCENVGLIDAAITWNSECRKLIDLNVRSSSDLSLNLARHAKLLEMQGRSTESASAFQESVKYAEAIGEDRDEVEFYSQVCRVHSFLAGQQHERALSEIDQLEAKQDIKCQAYPAWRNSQFAAELLVWRGLAEEKAGKLELAKEHLSKGLSQWSERARGDLPSMTEGVTTIVRACNRLGCADDGRYWDARRRAIEEKVLPLRNELIAITKMCRVEVDDTRSTEPDK